MFKRTYVGRVSVKWTCDGCTFVNEALAEVCEICGNPAPNRSVSVANSPVAKRVASNQTSNSVVDLWTVSEFELLGDEKSDSNSTPKTGSGRINSHW